MQPSVAQSKIERLRLNVGPKINPFTAPGKVISNFAIDPWRVEAASRPQLTPVRMQIQQLSTKKEINFDRMR
jgi:hypothetical protein